MSQIIVRARVRPARVAVLVNRNGSQSDFVLAVRFLSRLWGGMYAPILPADPSPPDALTVFRLSTARPDYVYSIGLDGIAWMPRVQEACQPRGYRILDEGFLKELYNCHREEHITDKHLLNHMFRRQNGGGYKRSTRLIFWDKSSDIFPYAAALFGIPYKVRPNPFAPVEYDGDWGDQREPATLIRTFSAIVEKYEQYWMELTSQGLDTQFHSHGTGHPTIVLVDNLVEDLSLFWNLRMEGPEWIAKWIIPLPASITRDEAHARLLREWILGFTKYHQTPNYIFITSKSVATEQQQEFADWLRQNLDETPIKFVDIWPPTNRIPNVTAFESEELVEIRRQGQRATWLRPRSEVAQRFGSRISWMVDLVEDSTKGRSPFELSLPPGRTTTDILNAPSPPTVSHYAVDPYGQGVDSINIRCRN